MSHISSKYLYLTKRQMDVISLLEPGIRHKEIAEKLNSSVSCVNRHVCNILKTLELPTLKEVIKIKDTLDLEAWKEAQERVETEKLVEKSEKISQKLRGRVQSGQNVGRTKKRNDALIRSLRNKGFSYAMIARATGYSKAAVRVSLTSVSTIEPLAAELLLPKPYFPQP